MKGKLLVLRERLSGLGFAAGVALFFLVLSYVRLAGDSMSAAFHNTVVDSLGVGALWGTALARDLLAFVAALVLLHLAFGLAGWVMARISKYALPKARSTLKQWVTLWMCVGVVWVLTANAALFPHSSLGEPYADTATRAVAGINLFQLTTWLIAAACISAIAAAAFRWIREHKRVRAHHAVAMLGATVVVAAMAAPMPESRAPATSKPHVIVLGIDSLRADSITLEDRPGRARHVREFLAESIAFSDATTPLARTFPSWVSILTGKHPHTTGAIMNLLPPSLIRKDETLPRMFKRAGYRTVYSIDETRFSNVDVSYGFDEAITPPMGAADFLIGWFGDTPLSNLLVNSRVGSWLFPHLYANRAVASTYDPDTHVERLARRLRFDEPTFAAMHLTLPHWPFTYAQSPRREGNGQRYYDMITRVDQQFADVLNVLERRGALENALVIVLSDHGEALNSAADTLVHEGDDLGVLFDLHKSPRGHGTDVLSPPQYRVILGVRAFGAAAKRLAGKPRVIDSPVSLEDIAPTLADLFDLEVHEPFDGLSLRPLLQDSPGGAQAFATRVRFTESEFNPVGVDSVTSGKISASGAANLIRFYNIDPVTDRITLRPELLPTILNDRQYAAFQPDKLLAALPHASGKGYNLVGVDRKAQRSQLLKALPSANAYPEFLELYEALEKRFNLRNRASPNGSAD